MFPDFNYSETNINNAKDFLLTTYNSIDKYKTSKIIGIGGTTPTLGFILSRSKIYDANIIDKIIIDYETNLALFKELCQYTPLELSHQFNINLKRAEILISGQLILLTLQNLLTKKSIYISSKGLRFGVIIDYLKNSNLL